MKTKKKMKKNISETDAVNTEIQTRAETEKKRKQQ